MDLSGLKSLMEVLDQIGLPRVGFNTKNSTKPFDLTSILANIKKHLNMDHLFSTEVFPDKKNQTINRIFITKPIDSFSFPP